MIQTLSAKLGIATGRNLAEVIRDRYPRPVVWAMWVISELVAMATDLAEFLGAALGFYLLFGIPLFAAGLLTGLITFLILGLQRYGFRPLEAVITALVGVIAASYLIETVLHVHPNRERDVVGSIISHAEEFGADLILLSTHGWGGMRDMLVGSNCSAGAAPTPAAHTAGEAWRVRRPATLRGQEAAASPWGDVTP